MEKLSYIRKRHISRSARKSLSKNTNSIGCPNRAFFVCSILVGGERCLKDHLLVLSALARRSFIQREREREKERERKREREKAMVYKSLLLHSSTPSLPLSATVPSPHPTAASPLSSVSEVGVVMRRRTDQERTRRRSATRSPAHLPLAAAAATATAAALLLLALALPLGEAAAAVAPREEDGAQPQVGGGQKTEEILTNVT